MQMMIKTKMNEMRLVDYSRNKEEEKITKDNKKEGK